MVLEQVGVLLEQGRKSISSPLLPNASWTLGGLEEDLWAVTSEGRLTDVKGIGKGIAGLITEALTEGTWGEIGELYTSVPSGLIEMLSILGLGPKRIKQFHDELQIESIDQLRAAGENGHLRELDRMGAKSEQKVLDGIELLKRFSGRRRLDVGLLVRRGFRGAYCGNGRCFKGPLGRFHTQAQRNDWRSGYRCGSIA